MRILMVTAIFWAGIACAQDGAPLSDAEKQQLQERAQSLHEKADALRAEAEELVATANKACWEKFLVNRCIDNAKKERQEKLVTVRALEKEARDIERSLRKRNFAEHEAKMAAEAPQRAADAAAQAEKNRQAQQEMMERVERKRLEAEQREKH
ncbi:MAG: hypothetical protein Q7U97_08045 [Rhodocyclaceae bacterium]|nr:hypothetical protein [Rhodocyclaceae bacterium]